MKSARLSRHDQICNQQTDRKIKNERLTEQNSCTGSEPGLKRFMHHMQPGVQDLIYHSDIPFDLGFNRIEAA